MVSRVTILVTTGDNVSYPHYMATRHAPLYLWVPFPPCGAIWSALALKFLNVYIDTVCYNSTVIYRHTLWHNYLYSSYQAVAITMASQA